MNCVFNELDKDHDGIISKKELFDLLKQQMPKQKAKKRVESIFLNLDISKNGRINYSTFLAAGMDKKEIFSNQNLWNAFKNIDANQNGYID